MKYSHCFVQFANKRYPKRFAGDAAFRQALKIISFITEADVIVKLLTAMDEEPEAPIVAPARGPPLWELADSDQSEDDEVSVDSIPGDHFDQSVSW